MQTKTTGRILYADILRIATIFFIVVFHVATERWFQSYNNPSEWYVLNVVAGALRWCVPLFFMLSGMNFLDPNRNVTYRKLFTKSLPRLVIALAFWSMVYKGFALIVKYYVGKEIITGGMVFDSLTLFVFQYSWYHLWFLYPLIGMYLLTPVLRLITRNASKKDLAYLLLLYLIFAWGMPLVYFYTNFRVALSIPDLIPYTGYFIAGYFFARYDLSKIETKLLYIVGAICWALTIGLHIVLCLIEGKSQFPYFFYYQSANIALTAFFVFVLVKNLINNSTKIKARLQDNKYVTLLAECSFGVYLTHVIFLNIFGGFLGINTSSFPALLSVPFFSIVTFALSLGLTMIIKKIPVLGKWIV